MPQDTKSPEARGSGGPWLSPELEPGLVSAIIPTYNYAHFLGEAIQSVVDQTYPHWECIVVDDGSTDGTRALVESFVREHGPERIRYFYQENRGLSAARNRGLGESRGEFLQFLDSDDFLTQNKIEDQAAFLGDCRDLDAVYCDTVYFRTENGTNRKLWSFARSGEDPLALALERPLGNVQAFLFRSGPVRSAGGFNEQCIYMHDLEFMFRLLLGGARIAYRAGEDAWYRQHPGSMMKKRDVRAKLSCQETFLRRTEETLANQGRIGRYRRHLARGYFNVGRGSLLCGQKNLAKEFFRSAGRVYWPLAVVACAYALAAGVASPRVVERALRFLRRRLDKGETLVGMENLELDTPIEKPKS